MILEMKHVTLQIMLYAEIFIPLREKKSLKYLNLTVVSDLYYF